VGGCSGGRGRGECARGSARRRVQTAGRWGMSTCDGCWRSGIDRTARLRASTDRTRPYSFSSVRRARRGRHERDFTFNTGVGNAWHAPASSPGPTVRAVPPLVRARTWTLSAPPSVPDSANREQHRGRRDGNARASPEHLYLWPERLAPRCLLQLSLKLVASRSGAPQPRVVQQARGTVHVQEEHGDALETR
jgi:hypothetical protein